MSFHHHSNASAYSSSASNAAIARDDGPVMHNAYQSNGTCTGTSGRTTTMMGEMVFDEAKNSIAIHTSSSAVYNGGTHQNNENQCSNNDKSIKYPSKNSIRKLNDSVPSPYQPGTKKRRL